MQFTSERISNEPPAEAISSPIPACCPACGGPLLELRTTLRCVRCHFTICDGCAGDPGDRIGTQGD